METITARISRFATLFWLASLYVLPTFPCVAQVPAERSSLVDRQVLLVLDPRQASPRAVDLVLRNTSRSGVAEVLQSLDGVESISRFQNSVDLDQTEELRRIDPLAPEVLLSEYLIITVQEGIDVDRFLDRIRQSRFVLSAERNLRGELAARFLDQGTSSNAASAG